jgi:predicted ATPase
LYENHRKVFDEILAIMRRRVPGISDVEARQTEDGRIVLRFQDGSFKDPFIARFVSDGTIKMFAYLVLLHDPKPHPLLCVEEPENQLYPNLMEELAEEFQSYAARGGQVFVSTHSPDFLNAVPVQSLFVILKEQGLSAIRSAAQFDQISNLVDAGDKLGWLWRQGMFKGVSPQ